MPAHQHAECRAVARHGPRHKIVVVHPGRS